MITDKGSAFLSQVLSEVAAVPSITLKHASTKHAQTTGVIERTHARKKNITQNGEDRRQWHKCLLLAILNYNTSYHTSLDREPTRVVHGRVPYNM